MVEVAREDIYAALLLSWLKYTPVTEEDVKNMKHIAVLDEKEPKNLEKSMRKLLRIRKNENPETRVRNSSSGLMMNLLKNSSGSSSIDDAKLLREKQSKNPETLAAGSFNPVSKRVRNSPSALMNLPKKTSGSNSVDGAELPRKKKQLRSKNPETLAAGDFNPVPKRVRNSHSALTNLPRNSSGSSSIDGADLPRFPPIEVLRTLIGKCSNPFMKQLTKSDVNEHQGRLLLNNDDVRKQLLPLLNEESEDLADGIKVTTFDPIGNFYNMRFKTWGNYKSYVLLGSWRQFIKEHKLKEHDFVTVWMFRHNQTGELCFALTWRKDEDEEEEEEEKEEEKIQEET
ncbi:hypothetical protein HAX54_033144 [Datura stramonium]|uniref:TF-B3 domain-containing protein n=1 Tax=Datura stramonium TaxID=4076 RepID=A0ABS8VEJ2_DATST|nr:hypothetical protein [Datura stramonium]